MKKIIFALLVSYSALSTALTFPIPRTNDVIGQLQTAVVMKGESFADIGRRFDLGIYEMIEANPDVDPWVPTVGSSVVIPSQFILPAGPRKGIVINLAEMRLYYYHPEERLVTTHPLGIGKKGWKTPLGTAKIIQKKENPSWRPPQSIRDDHAKRGDILPDVVPPGPDNPLGKYAMRLSMDGYLIHGTNRPGGIGVRSSSGCIRMFPEDIQSFYHKVALGTSVRIIHAPYKFGRYNNKLYLEAHEPLSEQYYSQKKDAATLYAEALEEAKMDNKDLDWIFAEQAIEQSDGYPTLIN